MAASPNNSLCAVGIAFNAKIGGIRMLDGRGKASIDFPLSEPVSCLSQPISPWDNWARGMAGSFEKLLSTSGTELTTFWFEKCRGVYSHFGEQDKADILNGTTVANIDSKVGGSGYPIRF